MASDESNRIWTAFTKYIKTADESHIVSFTSSEIERAITEFTNSKDRNTPTYKAMENRVSFLREREQSTQRSREKWVDRVVSFIIGLASGLIVAYLVWRLSWK